MGKDVPYIDSIRQELDIGKLLEVSAAEIMSLVGDCNLVLFLPSSVGDWRVAIIAAPMIDASLIGSIQERSEELIAGSMPFNFSSCLFEDAIQLSEVLSKDCSFFEDFGEVVLATGAYKNETLIAAMMFRPAAFPGAKRFLRNVERLLGAIAEQLQRCARIHSRALPLEENKN